MKAVVLGAAAGGGFPQWNSNAEACRRARAGDANASPRTQASLAVSGDGERWFLINASPDLRQQIEARAILHPRHGQRSSPIEGVILTGADVDAIAGLLHLRERQAFTLWATRRVLAVLKANPIFGVLAPECVSRRDVSLGQPFSSAISTPARAAWRSSCSMCPARWRCGWRTAATGPIWQASPATRWAWRCARGDGGCSTSRAVRA